MQHSRYVRMYTHVYLGLRPVTYWQRNQTILICQIDKYFGIARPLRYLCHAGNSM